MELLLISILVFKFCCIFYHCFEKEMYIYLGNFYHTEAPDDTYLLCNNIFLPWMLLCLCKVLYIMYKVNDSLFCACYNYI